jgi:hypothetical protein
MIMKKIIAITLLAGIVVACSKDKFQTKPQLKVKEQSTEIVPVNGNLSVTLEWTDKEGDVNDTLFITRQRVNAKGRVVFADSLPLPTFPGGTQGEIQVDFPYTLSSSGDARTSLTAGILPIGIPGTGTPPRKENDTLDLKFVLKDKGKNRSDTAVARVLVMRL